MPGAHFRSVFAYPCPRTKRSQRLPLDELEHWRDKWSGLAGFDDHCYLGKERIRIFAISNGAIYIRM
jgi:hypothetical protein